MKSLIKGTVPEVLVQNGAMWTHEYVAAVAQGGAKLPRRWAHSDIRRALSSETNERCMYCEGPLLAVSFGDVEHIRPRKIFPELAVEWSNLGLACQKCNNAKHDKWFDDPSFVNPYVDVIEHHIVFAGPIAWPVSPRGLLTIEEINLNDLAKVEARETQIRSIMDLFYLWATAPEALKDVIAARVGNLALLGEYSAASLGALKSAGFPLT